LLPFVFIIIFIIYFSDIPNQGAKLQKRKQ